MILARRCGRKFSSVISSARRLETRLENVNSTYRSFWTGNENQSSFNKDSGSTVNENLTLKDFFPQNKGKKIAMDGLNHSSNKNSNGFQHGDGSISFQVGGIENFSSFPGKNEKKKLYYETYGCQMNVNDLEIVLAILSEAGYSEHVNSPEAADVILINTCAIRENAESKIWHRLDFFKHLKRKWRANQRTSPHGSAIPRPPPKVAVLGCMAERLKTKLVEAEKMVDVVCGPDAYRDLPRLLAHVDSGQAGINTMLSLEETYADVSPVRIAKNSVTAFVSIMRGCDNMCSYCIVPFTRGRERSRPVDSIVREVQELWDEGVKEVTLLGQNVNSYRDSSDGWEVKQPGRQEEGSPLFEAESSEQRKEEGDLSRGFSTIYRAKSGGLRFSFLLDCLSTQFPEMRFRFTSPHPKDFPDDLLCLMRDRPNICKNIHLPAQSGSSSVLERMRRGYSREAYVDLVRRIREVIPGVAISSDFIAGFCGETEEEHEESVELMREIGYDMAYMFAYSMREKTHAHRKFEDDVPEEIKKRRLQELIQVFRETSAPRYESQIGQVQIVLVEGSSKRAPETEFAGRNDTNHRVIFPKVEMEEGSDMGHGGRMPRAGDFVAVRVTGTTHASLRGVPLSFAQVFDRTASDGGQMAVSR